MFSMLINIRKIRLHEFNCAISSQLLRVTLVQNVFDLFQKQNRNTEAKVHMDLHNHSMQD